MYLNMFYRRIFVSIALIGFLSACASSGSSERPHAEPSSIDGIEIYVSGAAISAKLLEEYFSSHSVMVAKIAKLSQDPGSYWVQYPSINFAESPMFSHQIKITLAKNAPIEIAELIEEGRRAVFVSEGAKDSWKLVGVIKEESVYQPFDWFSQRPRLLYKGNVEGE